MTHSKQIAEFREKFVKPVKHDGIMLWKDESYILDDTFEGQNQTYTHQIINIEKWLTSALETAERRGEERERERIFNRQELEIMWIDYKSLVATTKMMNRQVVGDKKLEFVLDANDQVREEILEKLEPYKPASLKPTEKENK